MVTIIKKNFINYLKWSLGRPKPKIITLLKVYDKVKEMIIIRISVKEKDRGKEKGRREKGGREGKEGNGGEGVRG